MSDEIRINTDSIRSYAGQLDSIQRQIYALNSEIWNFRYHTGKLWNVNTYGYEWAINPAKSYCVDTANEFESIERYLQGCDPEMYEGNTGWLAEVSKESPVLNGERIKDYVDSTISVIGGVILKGTKNEYKESKIPDLVKGLAGNIPIIGGVVGLAHNMCGVKWQDEPTIFGQVASFSSGMLKVGSGIFSIGKSAITLVDQQIEAVKNGYCVSTRWHNAIFGVKETVRGLNNVQKFQYGVRSTFNSEYNKLFNPGDTVLGKVECVAKWADVAADFLGYYKDDKDKYGTWGGVVSSVGKTTLKQAWKVGLKAGVAGALALTPLGGSAIAVGVATTVVSWGADCVVNKLSGGKYDSVGECISAGVDIWVDAGKKAVDSAKSKITKATKTVASWWKNTKKSLSFAF